MKTAIEIIHTLNKKGYEGYIVGGWVRDLILGVPSSDIDIATDASPEQVTELFKGEHWRIIPTGVEHGTVTIMHQHLNPDVGYECTTFRKDVATDGRNATVEFAETIHDDLSRRDFTINAIAYNPITDEYIDPFNGREDIEKGIIRCVGAANERFKEDHLRMLRALRFSTTLGFKINDETEEAIDENAHLIKNISSERIKMEIDKVFIKSNKPANLFYRTGVCLFHYILPELKSCIGFKQNKYHKYDVFIHTMEALNAVPKKYPLIRWAVLFHDLGKPVVCENYGTPNASFHKHELESEILATKIMERLKFSNEDKAYISNLVRCHMFQCSTELTDGAIRRFIAKLGVEYIDDIIILKYADRRGNPLKKSGELTLDTSLKRRATKILEEDSAFKVKDLNIAGRDVMELLNITQGPEVGKILSNLLEAVLDNPTLNNKADLIKLITDQNF